MKGSLIWDDDAYVTKPTLQSLSGLRRIWFEVGATEQYYPVLHSAFWVENRLWGDAPMGYHLVNILLHAAAASLFGLVLLRLWGMRANAAWLAAFLFALHPVSVESVAWISEQKNTLSTVFYLGSMLAYLRFDRERRTSQYLLALGLFAAAVLSKSVAATLPGALLVIFWWQRGKLSWRRDFVPLFPWFALGATVGLFTAWVERTYIGAAGALFHLNFAERFLIAGRMFWFYWGKVFWPSPLMFIYPRWKVSSAAAWQYLFPLALAALVAALWLIRKKSRGPLAGILLFLGALFPTSGFLNVYAFIFSYVADHWQYLAMMGVIAPAAWGWEYLGRAGISRSPASAWLQGMGASFAVAVLVVLGVLTWRQCREYRDDRTLYLTTIAKNPGSWMSHNNLGLMLEHSGHSIEAEAEFRAAIALEPDYAGAHYNLGNIWMRTPGRLNDAVSQYEEALRLEPGYVAAHNNLGHALEKLPGRLNDAIIQFKAALRLKPDDAEAHDNLGNALRAQGRTAEAIAQYKEALRLRPTDAEAHYNLGNALIAQGRTAEATAQYEEALRLRPNDADTRNNLGNILCAEGRTPEAIAQYEEALRLRPDDASLHLNLAIALLATPSRVNDAVTQLEVTLRLQPGNGAARQILSTVRRPQP